MTHLWKIGDPIAYPAVYKEKYFGSCSAVPRPESSSSSSSSRRNPPPHPDIGENAGPAAASSTVEGRTFIEGDCDAEDRAIAMKLVSYLTARGTCMDSARAESFYQVYHGAKDVVTKTVDKDICGKMIPARRTIDEFAQGFPEFFNVEASSASRTITLVEHSNSNSNQNGEESPTNKNAAPEPKDARLMRWMNSDDERFFSGCPLDAWESDATMSAGALQLEDEEHLGKEIIFQGLRFWFGVRRCEDDTIRATLKCKYCAYQLDSETLTIPALVALFHRAEKSRTIIKRAELRLKVPEDDEPVSVVVEVVLGSHAEICGDAGFFDPNTKDFYMRAQFHA